MDIGDKTVIARQVHASTAMMFAQYHILHLQNRFGRISEGLVNLFDAERIDTFNIHGSTPLDRGFRGGLAFKIRHCKRNALECQVLGHRAARRDRGISCDNFHRGNNLHFSPRRSIGQHRARHQVSEERAHPTCSSVTRQTRTKSYVNGTISRYYAPTHDRARASPSA